MPKIDSYLRVLRRSRGLSQKTIAQHLKISTKEISLHETGSRRSYPAFVSSYIQCLSPLSKDEWLGLYRTLLEDTLEVLTGSLLVVCSEDRVDFESPLPSSSRSMISVSDDLTLLCNIEVRNTPCTIPSKSSAGTERPG